MLLFDCIIKDTQMNLSKAIKSEDAEKEIQECCKKLPCLGCLVRPVCCIEKSNGHMHILSRDCNLFSDWRNCRNELITSRLLDYSTWNIVATKYIQELFSERR